MRWRRRSWVTIRGPRGALRHSGPVRIRCSSPSGMAWARRTCAESMCAACRSREPCTVMKPDSLVAHALACSGELQFTGAELPAKAGSGTLKRAPRGLALALLFAASQCAQSRLTMFPPVRGLHEMVGSCNNFEVDAGMRILAQGGNAVDAGVATTLAAGVTELDHFGLGGEIPIRSDNNFEVDAGMRILAQGGNAVDARVATTLAAGVTELDHFGLGGEIPILIKLAGKPVIANGGIGTAPKRATVADGDDGLAGQFD